ncbi:MAG: hypothetical protein AB7S26_38780 [Sandaracinaceae bacterium]
MTARLRRLGPLFLLLSGLAPASLAAQPPDEAQDEGMPHGHPTTAPPGQEAMPPGHPVTPPPDQAAMPQDAMPPGHPTTAPSDDEAMPPGHPSTPPGQAMDGTPARLREVLQPPEAGTAAPASDLAPGTIRVLVVGPDGRPVSDAAVDVGSLASGERSRHNGRTDASGIAMFRDLPVGGSQAYRVNVPLDGAVYSTTPFQLPADHGYDVRITRTPTTHDPRFVFFHILRVVAEQRGERMHIIYQAELSNAGEQTFVFGDDTSAIALPEGYVNFQFQRVITDQRVEEVQGTNTYAIRGSLPPGTVRLAWAFELPVDDTEMNVPVQIPIRFYSLQVFAEAMPGLEMSVRGMPNAQRLDLQGQPCVDSTQTEGCAWVTMTRRGPDDATLDGITLRLTGIPGPPPIRWFAVGFAILLLLAGVVLFVRRSATTTDSAALRARKDELLDEVRDLEEGLESGEIGPNWHRRRKDEIVRELAIVLQRLGNTDDAAESAP